MFINVEQTQFFIECMNDSQLTESSFVGRAFKRYAFFLSFKYDKNQIQTIIDDYIEDLNIDGVKAFLFGIYTMTESDKPKGNFRKFLFNISLDIRQSYFKYKGEIKSQINDTAKRIYQITHNEDDLKLYDLYSGKLEELDQSPRTQVLSEIQENPSVLKQILIAGGTTLTILGAVGIFLMNALEKLVTAANVAFDTFSTLIKWGIVAIGIFVAIISFVIGIFF